MSTTRWFIVCLLVATFVVGCGESDDGNASDRLGDPAPAPKDEGEPDVLPRYDRFTFFNLSPTEDPEHAVEIVLTVQVAGGIEKTNADLTRVKHNEHGSVNLDEDWEVKKMKAKCTVEGTGTVVETPWIEVDPAEAVFVNGTFALFKDGAEWKIVGCGIQTDGQVRSKTSP